MHFFANISGQTRAAGVGWEARRRCRRGKGSGCFMRRQLKSGRWEASQARAREWLPASGRPCPRNGAASDGQRGRCAGTAAESRKLRGDNGPKGESRCLKPDQGDSSILLNRGCTLRYRNRGATGTRVGWRDQSSMRREGRVAVKQGQKKISRRARPLPEDAEAGPGWRQSGMEEARGKDFP